MTVSLCLLFQIYRASAEWTKSDFATRKLHVELLLEGLEHKDAEVRFTNARRLHYILQGKLALIFFQLKHVFDCSTGTFSETSSPEQQLHWIIENCKVVRAANGLNSIVEAMKITCAKHDLIWYALPWESFVPNHPLFVGH